MSSGGGAAFEKAREVLQHVISTSIRVWDSHQCCADLALKLRDGNIDLFYVDGVDKTVIDKVWAQLLIETQPLP